MAEGEDEEDGGQQADEGGSVWEDDADCTWPVSDHEDDDDDDEAYVFTDALYFVPEVESRDESEESESLAPEGPANVFKIDVVSGRDEISAEAEIDVV